MIAGGITAFRKSVQLARTSSLTNPAQKALADQLTIAGRSSLGAGARRAIGAVAPVLPIIPGAQALAPLTPILTGGNMMRDPSAALAASQGANNPVLSQTADLPWWAQAGVAIAGRVFGGNGNGGGSPALAGNPCPTGFEWDGSRCVQTGVRGTIERFLPGGETGTGADVYGQAVIGAFGKPALVPFVEAQPTRRCPPGAVLGKDNLCYDRRSIRNSDRKWPKPPKPPITVADRKAIRRAASAQNRVKRLAGDVGFTCRPKGRR